ncbi:MAG: adenosylcobalamin-dependent ribonucleoside-diphosphate reductase [Rhodococcus sp.]|nr:adenosylcobalamin-dependent ribonucleoside-diphosphate reductase [Rhodococcus sp. (in: high G+C Gram-positive bacteria)]
MATEVQEAILRDRFYHDGEESWYDVCERVARTWGDTPQHVAAVYEMMRNKKGLPNTPAIANAGRPNQMGSACYVLPIEDSLTDGPSSIMQTLKDAAAVHKSGGGTGFSFGRIRGRGSAVSSTGRPAPGAVNVLELYSDSIARVTQAGMRPGANMGILPVDHPDIMEFIAAKSVEGTVLNFNISVAVTDEFMRKITRNGSGWTHEVWAEIVDHAWRNGEPGIVFIDTINRTALHPEPIEATNPCGEVPLRPYEACVLGSINLAEHLLADDCGIDYQALQATTRTMVRLLDNVIEYQDYPIPEIEREQKRYRKIGVGVMGYADMLIKLGFEYGSEAALMVAENVMSYIQDWTYNESYRLAEEKGPFDAWGAYDYCEAAGVETFAEKHGLPHRRNLMCQVIAPTGTISRLAGCSFGIEPIFAAEVNSFIVGGEFHEVHRLKDMPAFITAKDITPEQHLRTQAAFQTYTDQAVSKTLNLPRATTREDIANIYRMAWELGLKGVTVLREGSRDDVVLEDTSCETGVCTV